MSQNDFPTITAGSTIVLFAGVQSTGGAYVYGLVTSTQTFELYVEISPDNGVTFTQAKKIVSAAGPDATYTQSAELSQYAPTFYRVTAKNTSGSTSNFRVDIRHFEIFAH
jgi:hypothetical protein